MKIKPWTLNNFSKIKENFCVAHNLAGKRPVCSANHFGRTTKKEKSQYFESDATKAGSSRFHLLKMVDFGLRK